MFYRRILNVLLSLVVIASLSFGTSAQVLAQPLKAPSGQSATGGNLHGHVTPAERQAAAQRLQDALKKAGVSTQATPVMNPGGTPDYFGTTPNYANSPLPTLDINGNPVPGTGIRKFMDNLPMLGNPTLTPTLNDLNQYLPIALADTVTYPGSDYYEIAVVQYTQKLHIDLPPTTLRGYVQISTGAPGSQSYGKHLPLYVFGTTTQMLDNKGNPVFVVDNPQYLGPVIVAKSYNPAYPPGGTTPTGTNGQPTRIKFDNYLPAGVAGDLFIPTDTTYMGAGAGPTGEVTGISVANGGSGYATIPNVVISGGTPTINATAVATILNGAVNSLHITNPGQGYQTTDTLVATIDPPISGTTATANLSWIGSTPANYLQNRATLHLHGGVTPWISDGTPDQWTTPATENSPYPEGVSVVNVPDMPDPGPGSMTFFYTNQQSARLMFVHDHAYGITRLNVYAGEATGYLLQDNAELNLIANGTLPPASNEIPLIIQDKTFVPPTTQMAAEDPTWNYGSNPGTVVEGDLWYPHVYMPNQNPYDMAGVNAVGRWDYGPWFWPPYTGLVHGPVANPLSGSTPLEGPLNPGVPSLSGTPEAFMDTPLVNGTAYPVLNVQPQLYRFRILSVANDRMFNLQLYQATGIVGGITLTTPGSGYTDVPKVTITNGAGDTTGEGATAVASVDLDPTSLTYGQVNGLTLWTVGSGYTANPTVTIAPPAVGVAATASATFYSAANGSEVGMVPFTSSQNAVTPFPAGWYTAGNPYTLDDRNGGVPDPTTRGPAFVMIGTEGGVSPNPTVIPNTPINYDYNRRSITVLNVLQKGLMLGPAERADVIVDFSQFAGKTLIMYNDSPAPVPAADPRNDYFTGDPDQTSSGGAPTTLPGYGPNTRTIMKIVVAGSGGTAPVDAVNAANLAALQTAIPAAFAASQPAPIVPEPAYSNAYGTAYTGTYSRISDTTINFTPVGQTAPLTMDLQPKAIQELFTVDYGRMNATLGVEIPNTNATIQTTIPYGYIDPATELLEGTIPGTPIGTLGDGTQIWKITHNGVDTHVIHFHLFNVEVINRVGWDGAVKPPDAFELGWKDTVRMNPLEDVIVALTPVIPQNLPFAVPNSIRAYDVTQPLGSTMGFFGVDPAGNPSADVNNLINFGWEYVWHCHILGHEENDMMRPMMVAVAPAAPTNLTATPNGPPVTSIVLGWQNNANNATTYVIQRATDSGFTTGLTTFDSGGNLTTYTDNTVVPGPTYFYRVAASNVVGGNEPGFPSLAANSAWSNISPVGTGAPNAPTNFTATALNGGLVQLSWTDNATNEIGFTIQRNTGSGNLIFTTPSFSIPANPGSGNTVYYVDTTTGPGAIVYNYQIEANGGLGLNSAWVGPATVSLPTPPADPTGLALSLPSGTSVRLDWTNNASDANGFQIERSVNGGPFSVLVPVTANLTPLASGPAFYIDTTTIAGSTYAYQLRAYNTGGYSAFTTPVASILVSLPAAPTALTASYQPNPHPQITLGWQDNATNELNFVVERADNGGAFGALITLGAHAGTGAVGYIDTAVLDNSSYQYRVKAVNGLGSSAYTNTVTQPTLPAAPTGAVATLVNGGVQISFTDNALYETGFTLQRSVNGGAFATLLTLPALAGTGTVTYSDLTTPASSTIAYQVAAVNAAGSSAFAVSNSVLTQPTLAAPLYLNATLRNGGIVAITFRDNSSTETAFLLERSTNGGAFVVIATLPPKASSGTNVNTTDVTALAGNTYAYRVRAVRLGSSSPYSNTATVTLPALPTAPTNLTAVDAATRAVTLTFMDNALTENGFSLERSVNGGAFAVLVNLGIHAGTGTVTYNDTTAVLGTVYAYRVRAYNLGGYSAYTNTANITPAIPTAPSTLNATAIQVSSTSDQVTLTWVDTSTIETSFTVQWSTSSSFSTTTSATLPANATTYVRSYFTRARTYYFRVRAVNGYGNSAWTTTSLLTP